MLEAPEALGFKRYSLEDISGNSPEDNARSLMSIFNGEKGAKRDILVMNAGAGIYLGNGAATLEEGIRKAEEVIDSNAASRKLSSIIEYSNR